MILITGAGGKTGKAIVKALSKIEKVCAFVHHEEQVSAMESMGVERIVAGDMRDGSSIHSAMKGARAVYHICPNMSPDEVEIGRLVVEAAGETGLEHFVYHSVLHPQTEAMKHHWGKLQVEEMIFESGIPFTTLQPAPYMQNFLTHWRSIIEDGVLRMPYSVDARFSFIDLEDIAEAAKTVLTEPGHKDAIYELAGTTPTSHKDVAEVFSRTLDRDVHAEEESLESWKTHAKEMSGYALENLLKMFDYYDRYGLAGNPNVLRWVTKREPNSIETFIRRTLNEHETNH